MQIPINERPFIDSAPSVVNAVEIFSGEWACRFPQSFPNFKGAGAVAAFEDSRIVWANENLTKLGGGFEGAEVLELGPLEAAHTYMISRLGCKNILSIENNPRAFLKCLVVKEVMDIQRANFLLGDALLYLKENRRQFDIGVASAFLNHLVQPVEIIEKFSKCCRALFIWNVVFDESLFEKQPEIKPTFGFPRTSEWEGFHHTLYPHYYGQPADYSRFWGGSQPSCCWMRSKDILEAVKHFGFQKIEWKEEENPYGKALCLVACK
ncbi:MAG: hypothetical protein WC378_05615 [Opitutaceae bacterium]|jgi:hypothetical protein